jgi:peptidoglycan/LPS O-acetylase OafA/YrhL
MPRQSIRYQPALDGVRALAVAAVLVFHGGISWLPGGYLGVSVFFTLSGYLITSLLLVEHERHGTVNARAFYTRRARRLLPASLTCLVAVCVMAWAGWFRGVANLRRDVLGALFQVFNWVKLASGESYADLTTLNSGFRKPLEHYWSLAIEEQFYWLWPVAFIGIMAWARRSGRRPLVIVGWLTAISAVLAPIIARVWGPDAAYWATPARIAEILAGALLACWLPGRTLSPRARALAPVALAVLAVSCVLFPTGHGPAYQGALPLVAAVSALLILGLQVDGRARRVLSLPPLVGLGKISYGVYLYHWPIFVLIDRHRWSAPVGVLLLAKCAITLAVAVASFFLLERPVRRAEWLVPGRTLAAAVAGTAVVVAAVTLVPVSGLYYGVDQATADQAGFGTDSVVPLRPSSTSSTTTTSTVAPGSVVGSTAPVSPMPVSTMPASTTVAVLVPSRPVRIMVVGDSTANATGNGLVQWAAAHPEMAKVEIFHAAGCGLSLGGDLVLGTFVHSVDKSCRGFFASIPIKVAAAKPDVVMLLTTTWDVENRRLVKGGPELGTTDPTLRASIAASFASLTDALLSTGTSRIVWTHEPPAVAALLGPGDHQGELERHRTLYAIMDQLAEMHPDRVRVAPLAEWVEEQGLSADTVARPDAVHWTPAASLRIAESYLGPLLVREALT